VKGGSAKSPHEAKLTEKQHNAQPHPSPDCLKKQHLATTPRTSAISTLAAKNS